MYELRKGEEIIGLVEKPNYIRQHNNGRYVLCAEADAQGIAFNGTPYKLYGKEGIDAEEVFIVRTDAGQVFTPYSVSDDTDSMTIDHEYRLTLLELGVSEEVTN